MENEELGPLEIERLRQEALQKLIEEEGSGNTPTPQPGQENFDYRGMIQYYTAEHQPQKTEFVRVSPRGWRNFVLTGDPDHIYVACPKSPFPNGKCLSLQVEALPEGLTPDELLKVAPSRLVPAYIEGAKYEGRTDVKTGEFTPGLGCPIHDAADAAPTALNVVVQVLTPEQVEAMMRYAAEQVEAMKALAAQQKTVGPNTEQTP